MEVYILFGVSIHDIGEGETFSELEVLSCHATLEKAHQKVTSIVGKELPLVETSICLDAEYVPQFDNGWGIQFFDRKIAYSRYFILKQNME